MNFTWRDYDPKTMGYIENWLDEDAVKFTGLDQGFRDFYVYWAKEDGYVVGENFWCKVVSENGAPFAVVAFGLYEGKIIIMEIVIAPDKRGQGRGSKLLRELLEREEILGFAVQKSEAVIFPGNIASQKAFEKAGFRHHHTYEDGSAMLYVYGCDFKRCEGMECVCGYAEQNNPTTENQSFLSCPLAPKGAFLRHAENCILGVNFSSVHNMLWCAK